MNDEEVAFKIVRLYFEEIARLGFKRQLGLDQMINAYFYTLKKLKGKDVALKALAKKVWDEEKAKLTAKAASENKITSTSEKTKSTTTTTTTDSEKPKSTTVTEIIEEK